MIQNSINEPITYIDVTQLVHCQGRLTGIPRVIQELSVRFAHDTGVKTCFVSWVKETERFCEVNLLECIERRGNGIVYATNQGTNNKYMHKGKATNHPLAFAKKATKRALHIVSRINKRIATTIVSKLHAVAAQSLPEVIFKKDDMLFIPHGEWWDDRYIARLEALEREGVNLLQLIHDMLPIVTPQYSGHATGSFTKYCLKILPLSSKIVAISESTKRDIKNWMHGNQLEPPKIIVFREGEDFQFTKATRPRDVVFTQSGLKGDDYILCVGTIEARKNHTLLYYVYKQAAIEGFALPKLVIVGRRGWKTENIIDIIQADPHTKDTMLLMTNISDEELSWLYDNCLFSIYPSFYEGWGLPIAESLSRGVPCIASNTSSMVEIAPRITQHFSPTSTTECYDVIKNMLHGNTLEKARKLAKTFKKTTWDDSYKQLKSLIIES